MKEQTMINIGIKLLKNKEQDMKKMKSVDLGNRNKEDSVKIRLFSVMLAKGQ